MLLNKEAKKSNVLFCSLSIHEDSDYKSVYFSCRNFDFSLKRYFVLKMEPAPFCKTDINWFHRSDVIINHESTVFLKIRIDKARWLKILH